ncbi:SCO2524 family protein [Kibdelosporangium aridum]|uniref:Uncharacterized protein n=1 Tax=Kibdelosporangium aridum TaxID=2030 RepID=A0A1W1ZT04_KIBAR|nr:SCO2524 family protein [Kibdelosporangium aridum]SMC51524.1 hypothetical protein SAMN05661093_00304 [Kibdelosporangium aridum]
MRLQPRQQILDVWRSVAQYSRRGGTWNWGGRQQRNSISDAEQLLCLMYPAAVVSNLRLDEPDSTATDVLESLRKLGDGVEVPKLLIDVISEYMTTYTAEDGTPTFGGGRYFLSADPEGELTDKQLSLGVVDSFATAITLSLATLGFLKVFSRSVRRQAMKDKIETLEAATSKRLSAAMVGLLRCFSVYVFEPDSSPGRALCGTLNQQGEPARLVLERIQERLEGVRASFREAKLGLSQDDALDNPNMLFECGFSWGIVRDAPVIDTTEPVGDQPDGVALGAPYLYFTVVALDGISDLFSDRTRVLGLLNEEQQRLAQALQLRWDLTLEYWSAVARFGGGKWPLEDIPWRTTDEEESDYFSLLVTAVVLLDLLRRRATDDDLTRTVKVLEELAIRGRVNRRVIKGDAAIGLHAPGVSLKLSGAEKFGPEAKWVVSDFAVLLLKRAVRAAGLSRNRGARDRLLDVAEEALGHVWKRRLTDGPAQGLWDDPGQVFPGVVVDKQLPSWYLTERVIECLVLAASTVSESPIRSPRLVEIATDLLGEADQLFSQEQLAASQHENSAMQAAMQRIQGKLARARQLLQERPGTAAALIYEALGDLDQRAVARQDAIRSV